MEPEKNLPACVELLKRSFRVEQVSSFYETAPVGPAGPGKFWNAAVSLRCEEGEPPPLQALREIETRLGRKKDPSNKFSTRPIDIDILPQPEYLEQAFIMIPLAEIAPEERDTASGLTFREIADRLAAGFDFKKIE